MAQEAKAQQKQEPESEFKPLPFDQQLAKQGFRIRKIIVGQESLDDDFLPVFQQYFTNYEFAKWTLPENRKVVPKLRQDFYRAFLWATKPAQEGQANPAREVLNRHTRNVMARLLVTEGVDPVVQYNAAITIGRIYAQPPQRGVDQPIVPDPYATDTLVKALRSSRTSDLIKAGVLLGLKHHVDLGVTHIPAANREAMATVMLTLIRESKPPEGRQIEVHDWFRRRAAEILAAFGQPGGANEVPQALIGMLNEQDASLAVRCAAAEALGKIQYEGDLNIDSAALAEGLVRLAAESLSDGIRKVNSLGGSSARRSVAAQFVCLSGSIGALSKLARTEQKKADETLKAVVPETLDTLTSTDDGRRLEVAFKKSLQQLDILRGAAASTAEPADAEAEAKADPDTEEKKPASKLLELDF